MKIKQIYLEMNQNFLKLYKDDKNDLLHNDKSN